MNIPELFQAVKTGAPEEKVAFWRLCKTAALSHPNGISVGLTKIALDVWADSYSRGFDPLADRAGREAFAASFGAAASVDHAISKMAAEGVISEDEQEKLASWLAESAVNDLAEISKSAGALDLLKKPQVMGAISGAVLGAGFGAWQDKDNNRARGAIAGAIPGAIIGATLGQGYASHKEEVADYLKTLSEAAKAPKAPKAPKKASEYLGKFSDVMPGLDQGGQPPMNAADPQMPSQEGGEGLPQAPQAETVDNQAQIADGALDGLEKANKIVDNMAFLAQQVNLPQLAQDLTTNRDQMAQHFAAGNNYLPPELQHHFAQSEHAEAFMKKYKQRFGAIASSTKKTASYVAPTSYARKTANLVGSPEYAQQDWLTWRTQR